MFKNNVITHKIIPIFIIVIFSLFTFLINNVNASYTFDSYYDDTITYNLPDLPSLDILDNGYYIYYEENTSELFFLCILKEKDNFYYCSDGRFYSTCGIDVYQVSNNNLESGWNYRESGGAGARDFVSTSRGHIINIYGTVYTDDKKSDIFFQVAPLEITKVLVEATTKTQILEQLKTMIVGFLKYLIVFVVSVIAFWKGWQFLLKQLRKA